MENTHRLTYRIECDLDTSNIQHGSHDAICFGRIPHKGLTPAEAEDSLRRLSASGDWEDGRPEYRIVPEEAN